MSIFNFTSNLTMITDLVSVASQATNGMLGFVLWIIIGGVAFLVTSSFNFKDSLISSMFILFASSIFLRYLGLLDDFFVGLSLLLILGAFFFSLSKGGGAEA